MSTEKPLNSMTPEELLQQVDDVLNYLSTTTVDLSPREYDTLEELKRRFEKLTTREQPNKNARSLPVVD